MDRINNIQQSQYAHTIQNIDSNSQSNTGWTQYVDLHDEPNTFGSTSRPNTP